MNCMITRTNYFSVTSEARFREIIESIDTKHPVKVFMEKFDGVMKFGFGCYDTLCNIPVNDSDSFDFYGLIDALQEIIPDGDAIVMIEETQNGCEYTVITHDDVQFIGMWQPAAMLAREMLKDPTYNLKIRY